jgi:hypothetical protein
MLPPVTATELKTASLILGSLRTATSTGIHAKIDTAHEDYTAANLFARLCEEATHDRTANRVLRANDRRKRSFQG